MPALSRQQAMAAHFYQFDGSHQNPNECTLCAMTSMLHMAARQSERTLDLQPAELGRFLDRIPFRHLRFPAWFPGPGGATHPLAAYAGMKRYLAKLRRDGEPLSWQPRLRSRQGLADSEAAIEAGQPTMIWGVGRTGIPHAVVPIKRLDGEWLVLDPGYPADKNPRKMSDEALEAWWTNFSFIYPRGMMLTLERED